MDVKIGKPYGECGFPVFVFCLFIQEHHSFLIISLSVQIRQAAALQVGSVLLPVSHIPALPQGGLPCHTVFYRRADFQGNTLPSVQSSALEWLSPKHESLRFCLENNNHRRQLSYFPRICRFHSSSAFPVPAAAAFKVRI